MSDVYVVKEKRVYGYYVCRACGCEYIALNTRKNYDELEELHLKSCPKCLIQNYEENTLNSSQTDTIYRLRKKLEELEETGGERRNDSFD